MLTSSSWTKDWSLWNGVLADILPDGHQHQLLAYQQKIARDSHPASGKVIITRVQKLVKSWNCNHCDRVKVGHYLALHESLRQELRWLLEYFVQNCYSNLWLNLKEKKDGSWIAAGIPICLQYKSSEKKGDSEPHYLRYHNQEWKNLHHTVTYNQVFYKENKRNRLRSKWEKVKKSTSHLEGKYVRCSNIKYSSSQLNSAFDMCQIKHGN